MPAAKNPGGQAGKGRKPGARGKKQLTLAEEIRQALREAGDEIAAGTGAVGYFKRLSKDNPSVFAGLVKALIPLSVEHKVNTMDVRTTRIDWAGNRTIEHDPQETAIDRSGGAEEAEEAGS